MKFPLYQIDAFTDRVFGGNPAAVVILSEWLPDAVLQNIAAENNLSETAFVIAREGMSPLRWFTPTTEVELCGHATLATAHVLFQETFPSAKRLSFESKSGILNVERDRDLLTLDFPSRPGKPVAVSDELVKALGAKPREARQSRDLLAVFDDEETIRNMKPDMQRVAAMEAFAIIVSAPGKTVDFVSRFFAPRCGIPEDPVTGSAHCTLMPYWAERLDKSKLTARQLSARGGELICELRGERVLISGKAVEYLRGEIFVSRIFH